MRDAIGTNLWRLLWGQELLWKMKIFGACWGSHFCHPERLYLPEAVVTLCQVERERETNTEKERKKESEREVMD